MRVVPRKVWPFVPNAGTEGLCFCVKGGPSMLLFTSGAFEVIFTLMFLLVFGMILVSIISGVRQWNQNNHSPRLTVGALVVAKRTSVSHHHHHDANGMGHTTHSTSYYATFQVESGDRMELSLGGREYGMLAEGDRGYLTFQGTRYLGFERTQP